MMNTFWAVLLMVAVVLGLRLLSQRRSGARRSALLDIAAQLGLRVQARDALGTLVSEAAPAAGASKARPLADGLTAVWGTRLELHGEWNGRVVSINAMPKPRYRMSIAAQCRVPRELGLFASHGTSVHGAPPTPLTRIKSGDDPFDRVVTVSGKDVAGVEAFIRRPLVRRALLEVVTQSTDVRVYENWVYVVPYEVAVADANAARRLLDDVTRMAEVLDRAVGEPPVSRWSPSSAPSGDRG